MAEPPSRFRAWRIAAGWTEAEVAGLTGLSDSMISRVETGTRQLSPATKVRVARALGARVDDLFDPPAVEGRA